MAHTSSWCCVLADGVPGRVPDRAPAGGIRRAAVADHLILAPVGYRPLPPTF
ncbi:hypothetical protein [Promicromonospora soli]